MPTSGYFLNLNCVTNKRKSLDAKRTFVMLDITQRLIYAAGDRDVNTFDLKTNSFQETVQN